LREARSFFTNGNNPMSPTTPIKNKALQLPTTLVVFCMKKSPNPQLTNAMSANNIPT
jgi:hypothetical protein